MGHGRGRDARGIGEDARSETTFAAVPGQFAPPWPLPRRAVEVCQLPVVPLVEPARQTVDGCDDPLDRLVGPGRHVGLHVLTNRLGRTRPALRRTSHDRSVPHHNIRFRSLRSRTYDVRTARVRNRRLVSRFTGSLTFGGKAGHVMRRAGFITAACFAGSLGWGAILPFQYAYVVDTRNWGATTGMLTGTLFCIGAVLTAPVAGRLADRYSAGCRGRVVPVVGA